MKLSKLLSKGVVLSEMPVLVEVGGKKYTVLTAKQLRNQTRTGPDKYFGIVLGKEVDWRELAKEEYGKTT